MSSLEELTTELTGVWSLDKSKSEPLEPLLVLQGFGWIKRKAAAAFGQTQAISFETKDIEDTKVVTVKIQTTTGPVSTEVEGVVDGEPGSMAGEGEGSTGAEIAIVTVVPCTYEGCKELMLNVEFVLANGDVRTVSHAISSDGTTKVTKMSYETGPSEKRVSATVNRIFTRSS